MCVCLSVQMISAIARNKTSKDQYLKLQCDMGKFFWKAISLKMKLWRHLHTLVAVGTKAATFRSPFRQLSLLNIFKDVKHHLKYESM